MPRKTPAFRLTKATDPGARVDFDGVVGTVWSDGPVASSRFVICDDGRTAVLKVTKPKGEAPRWAHVVDRDFQWRDLVRAVERVRREGTVAYVTEDNLHAGWGARVKTERTVQHVDRDCGAIAGERAEDRDAGAQVVTDRLLGRSGDYFGSGDLCRCVSGIRVPAEAAA